MGTFLWWWAGTAGPTFIRLLHSSKSPPDVIYKSPLDVIERTISYHPTQQAHSHQSTNFPLKNNIRTNSKEMFLSEGTNSEWKYMKQKRPSSRDNCQEDTSDPENVKFPPDCSCVVSQSFTDSMSVSPSFIRYKGQVKFYRLSMSLKTVYPS
jgi:hypothetical protein